MASDGADANAGTADAPVATLERAVRLAETQAGPCEVVVHEGTYFPLKTIRLRNPDPKQRGLLIRAADNETPVFDGSVPIEKAEPMAGFPGVYTVQGEFPTDEPPTIWDEETGRHFVKLAAVESVQATDYSSVVLDERTVAVRCRDGMSPVEAGLRMSRRGVMYGIQILRDDVTLRGLEFRNFVERQAAAGVIVGGTGQVKGRGKERTGDFTANNLVDSCVARNCYFAFRVYVGGKNSRFTRCRARNCVTGVWISGLDTVVEHSRFVNDPDWHSKKLTWDREFDRRGVSFYHKPEDAVIRFNFIKNFRTGIFSKWSPGRYLIENNTFVNGQTALAPDPGFRMRRNIFAGYRTPFSDRRGEKATIDYNLFWGRHNFSRAIHNAANGAGPHNVFADPRFASPEGDDYRLLPGSPAIGLGAEGYAGAFPPVPEGYRGPPSLRVTLPRERGAQSADPSPAEGLPEGACFLSSRREVKVNFTVNSIAPAVKIRFGAGDGPTSERDFKPSDTFELPDEDGLRKLRFQVQDANGAWSDESVVYVTLRRGGVRLVEAPRIVANRYGALFAFQADRPAWGKLEYRDGEQWVEAANTKAFAGHAGSGALPLPVVGLPPDRPHRYRLTVSTALDSTVTEGEFTLSGDPKKLYVSTEGEDVEGAGSREKPFRTLQFALDRALPGDRVRVEPGVYFDGVVLNHGGTKEQPLTVEGLSPDSVTLDGRREVRILFLLRKAPHVVLRNLNFRWYGYAAVFARDSENVHVTHCRFRNQYWRGGSGIVCRTLNFSYSPNFTVDHCIVVRTRYGLEAYHSSGGRILRNTFVDNGVTHILWRGEPDETIVIKYNSLNWNGNQMFNTSMPVETLRERAEIDWNNYGTTFRRPEGTETRHGKYGRSLERPFPYLPTNREFIVSQKVFVNLEDWREYSGKDQHSIFADPKWTDPAAGRFDVAADSPNLLPDGKVIGAVGYVGEKAEGEME